MADVVDSGIKDLIFDGENNERRSWVFFGRHVARSQVVFLVQVLIILIIVGVSVYKLTIATTCEQTTAWVAILSSSVGYMLPSPKL